MRTHHVWWPHLDRDPIFNPFVTVTQRSPTESSVELDSADEEENAENRTEQVSDQSPAGK